MLLSANHPRLRTEEHGCRRQSAAATLCGLRDSLGAVSLLGDNEDFRMVAGAARVGANTQGVKDGVKYLVLRDQGLPCVHFLGA